MIQGAQDAYSIVLKWEMSDEVSEIREMKE
jgi:hypothetical protein